MQQEIRGLAGAKIPMDSPGFPMMADVALAECEPNRFAEEFSRRQHGLRCVSMRWAPAGHPVSLP